MTLGEMPQLQTLTKEEKLRLVEDLRDAIAAMPDDLPVSDALPLEEFKKRLAERL